MAAKKKFDIKSTLTIPAKQLTPEHIELATRQIHATNENVVPTPEATPPPRKNRKKTTVRKQKQVEQPTFSVVAEPPAAPYKIAPTARRHENEKKVRLSVDVSPATHKKLKLKAIENDTDIMHYVEMLIERDLGLK